MNKSRKLTLILAFALVLTVSAAFALTEGVLIFNGTATLIGEFAVIFDDGTPSITGTGTAGSTGSMTLAGTTATVAVTITEPGAEVDFAGIEIANAGNLDAILIALSGHDLFTATPTGGTVPAVEDALGLLEITGTLTEIASEILDAGTTETYDLKVKWMDSAAAFADHTITFTMELDYMQAP